MQVADLLLVQLIFQVLYRRENASCVSSHPVQMIVFREGSVQNEHFYLIVVVPALRKIQHYDNIINFYLTFLSALRLTTI